jgi:hypothetical protein
MKTEIRLGDLPLGSTFRDKEGREWTIAKNFNKSHVPSKAISIIWGLFYQTQRKGSPFRVVLGKGANRGYVDILEADTLVFPLE